MFDENDGFFDHMPPPAPPSPDPHAAGGFAGASSIATDDDYHRHPAPGEQKVDLPELRGRPYGLGPRVPLYVISPWSRGGWVDSQVYDHTSVLRLLERRFGVPAPEITPWRRAVCGDLVNAFDFRTADAPVRRGAARCQRNRSAQQPCANTHCHRCLPRCNRRSSPSVHAVRGRCRIAKAWNWPRCPSLAR